MTTKIENLSQEDYNMVIMLVNRLSEKSENGEMKRMSEDELVEQLSDSIRKSNMGLTKSAREVSRSTNVSSNLPYSGIYLITAWVILGCETAR